MWWGPLEGLKAATHDRISALSVVRSFAPGEIVFLQGDDAFSFYIVQSGRFEVEVSTPDGETMQLRIHGPGAHFGEMALLDQRLGRTGTVRAIERSSALVITAELFAELRVMDPGIDRSLITALCDLVVLLTQERTDQAFLTADRRLARRLNALTMIYAAPNSRDDEAVSIPVTQEHFASAVGATRTTINRLLGDLAAKGVLERSRNRIVVTDRRALRALAY
jgi:CRP/FNR family transcriptional regulator, cyclic AMP receptor protein